MTMKRSIIHLLACCAYTAVASVAFAAPAFTKQADVKVTMSDGIHLATDVYLPKSGTSFPAILVRTPYDKGSKGWFAEPMVEKGYAVVVQDVRGQQGSEGQFIPFIHERTDGLDTLNWIAEQTWCNGKIGMWGSSYLAYCALVVAPENQPNLKAIVNISGWGTTSDMTTPGGALHLMIALPWTLSNQIRGKGSFHDFKWADVFAHVPVVESPKALGIESAQWEGMVQLVNSDKLDDIAGISTQYDRISVPIYHITGWYDFVSPNTLQAYEGIDRAGKSTQKLMVAPWRHDQQWRDFTTVGDEDFGPQAKPGLDKMLAETDKWFDHWLKGIDNGVTKENPVNLFVMGDNDWHEFDAWPPKKSKVQPWYFDSEHGANSDAGDGTLSVQTPAGGAHDSFVYDPMNPVPTNGGANCHFFLDNLGVKDQREIEKRDDVLVYTSAPMKHKTTIIGPLRAVIHASTEGKQTDFTAKLVEVRSDGYARIIADGIKRGPDDIHGASVKTMEPGKVYRFTIDMGGTAIAIKKGHQLRVEVSSSNFPKYTRNPNTGEPPELTTDFRKVTQKLMHTAEYPSHVLLHVMP